MDVLQLLAEELKDYNPQIVLENEIRTFKIRNPFWEEDLVVVNEGLVGDHDRIIVHFSYQHNHFDNGELDELVEYIKDILNSKRIVYEFFVEDKHSYGGDSKVSETDMSSDESTIRSFFNTTDDYWSLINYTSYLKHSSGTKRCCKIRSWDKRYHKDIYF